MTLPKPGTTVDALACPKCGAVFKDKKPEDCADPDCFHKKPVASDAGV